MEKSLVFHCFLLAAHYFVLFFVLFFVCLFVYLLVKTFSDILWYIILHYIFFKQIKKATQGIYLIRDSQVAEWTDANYYNKFMKNSLNSYYISGIAWLYDEPNECRKWTTFFFKLGIAWYLLTSCKHVLILNLICSFFLILFFGAHTLSIDVSMFVFSPTCIRREVPYVIFCQRLAMINQHL